MTWSRRTFLETSALGGLAALFPLTPRDPSMPSADPILMRTIPSTSERIPAVGLGTWQTFDVGTGADERAPLMAVLKRFTERGGHLVDSSPMYRRAEGVVGELAREAGLTDSLFLATKVWTRGRAEGIAQMERSFRLMGTDVMDLMQVHNLQDMATYLPIMRSWKEAGRIRYIGVTHYRVDAHARLEQVVQEEPLDFVQVNYSIASHQAADRLLPLAAERGVATLINMPFESGALFRAVRGHQLPDWAREFGCAGWGSFFLKYILGNEHVTCVIPATSDPGHLDDNMDAGYGRLPTPEERQRMVRFVEGL